MNKCKYNKSKIEKEKKRLNEIVKFCFRFYILFFLSKLRSMKINDSIKIMLLYVLYWTLKNKKGYFGTLLVTAQVRK